MTNSTSESVISNLESHTENASADSQQRPAYVEPSLLSKITQAAVIGFLESDLVHGMFWVAVSLSCGVFGITLAAWQLPDASPNLHALLGVSSQILLIVWILIEGLAMRSNTASGAFANVHRRENITMKMYLESVWDELEELVRFFWSKDFLWFTLKSLAVLCLVALVFHLTMWLFPQGGVNFAAVLSILAQIVFTILAWPKDAWPRHSRRSR